MIIRIFIFLYLISLVYSNKLKLQWNIEEPFKYTGFIYSDSRMVIINPVLQIKITNNEEICNFYINQSDPWVGNIIPFTAVVKSAHLGIGELVLKSDMNLERWIDKDITFFILAEACHDPDSWSVPAFVSIKVLNPPGPFWSEKSYNVVVKRNVPIGTAILKVTAYLPSSTDVENKICQYSLEPSSQPQFEIDGEGMIKTRAQLTSLKSEYMTLVVVAEDCSQPMHRKSKVNVFISVNPSCKLGWTGFYTVLNYKPGSGIKYLSKNPKFQLCNSGEQIDLSPNADTTIKDCINNKTLRLTTSVELKSPSRTSANVDLNDRSNCKLDFESLRLQREVCGINDFKTVDLLFELTRRRTSVMILPMMSNIFPVISIPTENKFSFYFWMKREQTVDIFEEYIICQIDEIGNNIFSVSVKECALRVQLKSYRYLNYVENGQNIPIVWIFTLPQICDYKWHHFVILAVRGYENPYYAQLSLFMDGEMVDYKDNNPQIILNIPLYRIVSNMTDIFFGQCPKREKTEFKGLLAGVTLVRGVVLKSSTSRCFTQCSERLFFNGMNQMNPGMSVSLNSEMQMIIINGHSIDEVGRLIKVIGFVNPTWNPKAEERELNIETEMSCGKKVFSVPSKKIIIKIEKQRSIMSNNDTLTVINLLSTVTTVLIPDSTQSNSDMGTGVVIFANTSLEITGIPQSTNSKIYDVVPAISKCVVKIHPKLSSNEYLEWPSHFLDSLSAQKPSVKVMNTSKIIIFQGLQNQEVYQFVIQNLRYFSTSMNHIGQVSKIFKLQCFSLSGKETVKSNVASVKVTIWYNNESVEKDQTTVKPEYNQGSNKESDMWKDVLNNITMVKNYISLHSGSDAALISEMNLNPKKTTYVMYNVLLGFGLVGLIFVLILFIKKSRKRQNRYGFVYSYKFFDKICFPLQILKEKIKPSPSVRVELSRDFINCTSGKRRDISMEMQWDDTELKTNRGFNIIANPMYESPVANIDDSNINKDVPPACEEDDSSSEDDVYEDFTEIYFERNPSNDKIKMK